MPLYPLDVSKTIEAAARMRFVQAIPVAKSSQVTSGSGFTVTQFRDAAALYTQRAEQTSVFSERREYEALARRFADEAENRHINAPVPT